MTSVTRALVTGGAGFIGSHIVDELLLRGIETYVIDNFSTGNMENLAQHQNSKDLHVIKGDARKAPDLLKGLPIDVVFHEAAIASVPRSITQPGLVHDVNVNMTIELLNYCVKSGVKKFVFASSAAVYGVVDADKASEHMVCAPNTPYGAGKLAVENYLSAYFSTYGLETTALRYFNVYGPRQQLSDYSGVITLFANKLLSGEPATIHGDGKQVRDFVHVQDIVQANMLAMESSNAVGEMFNVASGRATSILELFRIIAELTGSPNAECLFGPERPGDVRFGVAAIEKISQILGYKARFSMHEGLLSLVKSLSRQKFQLASQGEAA